MTISDIRNILEAPYNRKVWKSFIQTQFTDMYFVQNILNEKMAKNGVMNKM